MSRVDRQAFPKNDETANGFKRQIKLIRTAKGWSQEQVALQLGCSVPAYSKIETGITDVSLTRLLQIAQVLEVSVLDLIRPFLGANDEDHQMELVHNLKLLLSQKDQLIIRLQSQVIELMAKAETNEMVSELS